MYLNAYVKNEERLKINGISIYLPQEVRKRILHSGCVLVGYWVAGGQK